MPKYKVRLFDNNKPVPGGPEFPCVEADSKEEAIEATFAPGTRPRDYYPYHFVAEEITTKFDVFLLVPRSNEPDWKAEAVDCDAAIDSISDDPIINVYRNTDTPFYIVAREADEDEYLEPEAEEALNEE